MLGFLLILSYDSGANLKEYLAHPEGYVIGIRKYFGLIVIEEEDLLLLFFLIFTLLQGKSNLVIASAATLALVLALTYLNHDQVGEHSSVNLGHLWEVSEYLLGIGCLFYCLQLLMAQGRLAAISRASLSGLKPAGGRIPFQPMTCRLVIAGSIGLMLFVYFNAMSRTAAIEEAYRSITAGEPVVRSDFDVYLSENELIYVKEPCVPADTEATFFLHLRPVDVNDLPDDRKQHGFDNLDFSFDQRDVIFDGKCMATVALPEYAIARIDTGQFVTVSSYNHLWEAEFRLEP